MTQPICSICYDLTPEPIVGICDSEPVHSFHLSCTQTWIDQQQTSCPLCRRHIVDLTFQEDETTPHERSLQFAARHENRVALTRLIQNDEDLARAIVFLPKQSPLIDELMSQILDPANFLDFVVCFATFEPNLDLLDKFAQADPQLSEALNAPCLNWDRLATFCFQKAQNQAQVREEALQLAAMDGNLSAIQKLIAPIGELGPFFDGTPQTEELRRKAIALSIESGHLEVAAFLIETDSDRAFAISLLLPQDLDFAKELIHQATNPFWVRKTTFENLCFEDLYLFNLLIDEAESPVEARLQAIEIAASKGNLNLLQALIRSEQDRTQALLALPSQYLRLCRSIVTDAVRETAILMAAEQEKILLLQTLILNDEHRILALTFLKNEELYASILASAQNPARVHSQAQHLRSQMLFPPSKKPRL